MKTLTISNPFGPLIASGDKFVENRNWATRYRGPLLIHAGKGTQYMTLRQMATERLPVGKIIAVAELQACVSLAHVMSVCQTNYRDAEVPGTNRTWLDVRRHKHTEGPWCWILGNIREIGPIECSGAQGLWECNLEAAIKAAAGMAT